jgi:hypothetical protein
MDFEARAEAIQSRAFIRYTKSLRLDMKEIARRIEQDKRLDNAQLAFTVPTLRKCTMPNMVVGICTRIVKQIQSNTFDLTELVRGTVLDSAVDGIAALTHAMMEFVEATLREHCRPDSNFVQTLNAVSQFACNHAYMFAALAGMVFRIVGGAVFDLWAGKPVRWSEHLMLSTLQSILGTVLTVFSSGAFSTVMTICAVTWFMCRVRNKIEDERILQGTVSLKTVSTAFATGIKEGFVAIMSSLKPRRQAPTVSDDEPDSMCCTICFEVLTDCYMLRGHPYHYRCIKQCLDTRLEDPLSRVPVTRKEIIHCPEMEELVSQFLQVRSV